jgi:hypothetical protein
MGVGWGTRATGARRREWHRCRLGIVAGVAMSLAAAGCSTSPQPAALTAGPRGPTVAFESIDGPPESIFRKLVQSLSDEASSRQIAVVSRESPAQYRIRGYVAALVESRRATIIAWVWDVYDSNQRRALRITGEERTSGAGRGTWAAADDHLLRRIAKNGIDRLAAFLSAPDAEPGPPSPQERGPAVAANDDFAPGSAGIFRLLTNASAEEIARDGGPVPLPTQRPGGSSVAGALAYSDHDR